MDKNLIYFKLMIVFIAFSIFVFGVAFSTFSVLCFYGVILQPVQARSDMPALAKIPAMKEARDRR